ncbi:hypothetical protein FQN60_017198, partial [Etheostoma spectabile]
MCNATNKINTGDNSEPVCIEVLYPPTDPTLAMDTELSEDQLITINCTVESFPPSTLALKRTSKSKPQSSEYRPKDVTVKAEPALVVNENKSLTLRCSAQSHPPVTSITWMKMIDGKSKILQNGQTFIRTSVSPSDSGLYSCAASNDIGTGNSQKAEVKVKYAPKNTNITRAAEQQDPDGTRFVKLSCSSHSYPPVTQYSWYKIKAEEGDEKVSDRQSYTVYSNQPGGYYCIAKNEINQRKSDPVHLFDREFKASCLYEEEINSTRNYEHSDRFGFSGAEMTSCQTSHAIQMANDASLVQTGRKTAATHAVPTQDKAHSGPSAQKPIRKQGGHTQDDSLNYASLHFGNEQKHNPTKVEDVYSMVSKQKPLKKNDERLEDYENISTAPTVKSQNASNSDTDTSEDEIQINYSQVSFKPNSGLQRAVRDSSSSDDEGIQYSEVKSFSKPITSFCPPATLNQVTFIEGGLAMLKQVSKSVLEGEWDRELLPYSSTSLESLLLPPAWMELWMFELACSQVRLESNTWDRLQPLLQMVLHESSRWLSQEEGKLNVQGTITQDPL